MKKRNIALALSIAFAVPALTGCAAMRARNQAPVTGPNLQSPTVTVTDRTADDMRRMTPTESPGQADQRRLATPKTAAHHDMDYTSELSIDHLSALIGLSDRDIDTTLGAGRTAHGGADKNHTYTHKLYGKETDFDLRYDDQSRIREIVINLDKADAERWQRELTARYGARTVSGDAGYSWTDDNSRVTWTEMGDTVRIIFTGGTL